MDRRKDSRQAEETIHWQSLEQEGGRDGGRARGRQKYKALSGGQRKAPDGDERCNETQVRSRRCTGVMVI